MQVMGSFSDFGTTACSLEGSPASSGKAFALTAGTPLCAFALTRVLGQ